MYSESRAFSSFLNHCSNNALPWVLLAISIMISNSEVLILAGNVWKPYLFPRKVYKEKGIFIIYVIVGTKTVDMKGPYHKVRSSRDLLAQQDLLYTEVRDLVVIHDVIGDTPPHVYDLELQAKFTTESL